MVLGTIGRPRYRRCLSLLQLFEAVGFVAANSPTVLTPPIFLWVPFVARGGHLVHRATRISPAPLACLVDTMPHKSSLSRVCGEEYGVKSLVVGDV